MAAAAKYELARMTFREAEEAFAQNPVILVPMGSTEQHGPQCPIGDFRLANALSLQLAERTGALSAPVIPYSEGAAARNFPGAVPLRPETLYNLVWDVCEAYVRFDLDHIMLVSGDHGNIPILERMTRDFMDRKNIRIAIVEQYRWFTPQLLEKLYGVPSPPIGHGADPIMSLNLHLFPDDVRQDLVEPKIKKQFQGLTALSYSQVGFGDRMFYLPMEYDELSPNGVRGDADIASAEIGAKIWNEFLVIGTEIIQRFKDVDTRSSSERIRSNGLNGDRYGAEIPRP